MPRSLALPLILASLLTACGGGGGGSKNPGPPRALLINCLDRTAVSFVADAYEQDDIFNDYGLVDDPTNCPPGFAEYIDQDQVDAVFQATTSLSEWDMAVTLRPDGSSDGDTVFGQVNWAPGESTLYLKMDRTGPETPEPFLITEISEAEYLQLLSSGQIQGEIDS